MKPSRAFVVICVILIEKQVFSERDSTTYIIAASRLRPRRHGDPGPNPSTLVGPNGSRTGEDEVRDYTGYGRNFFPHFLGKY